MIIIITITKVNSCKKVQVHGGVLISSFGFYIVCMSIYLINQKAIGFNDVCFDISELFLLLCLPSCYYVVYFMRVSTIIVDNNYYCIFCYILY